MARTAKDFKKLIIAFSIVVVAGALGWFGQKTYEETYEGVLVYGNVDIRDVVLGFRVAGRLQELKYEEGDRVKKGDVLALLDPEPIEKELAVSKADLASIQATLVYVEKEYIRQKSLMEKKVNALKEFENAQSLYKDTLAKVNAAKARVSQSEIRLKDTQLLAPADGIILTRTKEPGSIVSEVSPIYTLSLEKPVWVRTYVDEPNLGNVWPGQKVSVETDSGKEYQGQVGFISPQAEFTPKNVETTDLRTGLVYRLRVIIPNPDEGLRQGMPVTLYLLPKNMQ